MIIVLFGQPDSGKTTIANAIGVLYKEIGEKNYPMIDGDVVRDVFKNYSYGREGRIENLTRITTIAKFCEKSYGFCVVSADYPYQSEREKLQNLAEDILWVRLKCNEDRGKKQYQIPDFEDEIPEHYNYLQINTSENDINATIMAVFMRLMSHLGIDYKKSN
jgi:hypothetical protein